jgi:hypothetical protein
VRVVLLVVQVRAAGAGSRVVVAGLAALAVDVLVHQRHLARAMLDFLFGLLELGRDLALLVAGLVPELLQRVQVAQALCVVAGTEVAVGQHALQVALGHKERTLRHWSVVA